jgi:hypothetical protein
VGLDGALADEERVRDLGVGQALGDQLKHVEFPPGQAVQPPVTRGLGLLDEPLDEAAGDGRRQQRVTRVRRAHRRDQVLR